MFVRRVMRRRVRELNSRRAAGSLGAGLLGGEAGEEVGDMIYEYMQ